MTILQSTENTRKTETENVARDDDLKVVTKSSSTATTAANANNHTTTTTTTTTIDNTTTKYYHDFVKCGIQQEIAKQVVRKKLAKLRHLVVKEAISPDYLDSIFPTLLKYFHPQTVTYNGGIANIKQWKISCYLEVMEGGVPTTEPNTELLQLFQPLLDACNDLFLYWFRQKSSCNKGSSSANATNKCTRLMTFITRYTPAPGEQALLKHVDGAGKVDGSIVVALPIDRWSAPESENSFIGHGGGLTFWDGRNRETGKPNEIDYDTRSGDLAFIDRGVWHQANPITKGTRWALVIFYKVEKDG